MNEEFPLIIIVRYQTCSILILSVISALHHVPLYMDRILLLLAPVETEVDEWRKVAILVRCSPGSQPAQNCEVSPVVVVLAYHKAFEHLNRLAGDHNK